MDEREQLVTHWADVAGRVNRFKAWIVAETTGLTPANITVFDFTSGNLVHYNFATDLSSWQVAVADTLFDNDTPDAALSVGEAIIEIGHLFAEQQAEQDELLEEELEDETAEAEEFLYEQAIEAAIEELESLIDDAQDQINEAEEGFDDEAVAGLQDVIDFLQGLIDTLEEKINQEGGSD